jgi:hypothetical protein
MAPVTLLVKKKNITRLGGWSMAKDATLGGRGYWPGVFAYILGSSRNYYEITHLSGLLQSSAITRLCSQSHAHVYAVVVCRCYLSR